MSNQTENILQQADKIFNDLLVKREVINRRKSQRFIDFLQNKELQGGSLEAQTKAFEALKGSEIDDEHELAEAAQLTAASLFDMLKKVATSSVPDLRSR